NPNKADQGKKSRSETRTTHGMSKGINHGTQPQKGTILLPTERRSDQKLLHNNAGKQRKQTSMSYRGQRY
ncbi:hypothetical protein, partial [Flavitalea sp.]|nr:hypothetical protein [Flavitalea sp.]